MWFWMSDSSLLFLYSLFADLSFCCCFNPSKWSIYSAVWLLRGWCHVKLLPSRRTFCVRHTTMHQFTVSLHEIHILRVFSSNLLPALLAEWPGSSMCYYGNMLMELRWNWYRNNNLYTYVKKKTTIKLKQIWPPAFWNKMKKVRTNTSFHKKTQNMHLKIK